MSITLILAFLKKIPIKDYLWAALAVALFAGALHERHEGAEKVERKDAALRAAAIALNKASESLADIKELNVGKVYEKYIALPPVPSTGLVCVKPAPIQPQASADRPEANDKADELPARSFDPSGPILTLLRDDDAKVIALQDTVQILVDELSGKTKGP